MKRESLFQLYHQKVNVKRFFKRILYSYIFKDKATTRTEESAPPTKYRRTQVHLTEGSENRSGSSSSHTPKGNNDIRSMIQEHLDNGKLVDIVNKDQDASYKEEKSMESKRKDLSGRKETLTEEDQPPRETGQDLNIQKKTDIITEEVFKALIEEFGQGIIFCFEEVFNVEKNLLILLDVNK